MLSALLYSRQCSSKAASPIFILLIEAKMMEKLPQPLLKCIIL
jgi:hypothetical protein